MEQDKDTTSVRFYLKAVAVILVLALVLSKGVPIVNRAMYGNAITSSRLGADAYESLLLLKNLQSSPTTVGRDDLTTASVVDTPVLAIAPSSTMPGPQVVAPGQLDVHIADFDLTLTGTATPAKLGRALYLRGICTPDPSASYVDASLLNVRYYSGTTLLATDEAFGGFPCGVLNAAYLQKTVALTPGVSKKISIYADIDPAAQWGTQYLFNFRASVYGAASVQDGYTAAPITVGPQTACSIDAFVPPTSTTAASKLVVTTTWATSNCTGVVLQIGVGSEQRRYSVPTTGSLRTSSRPTDRDTSMEVTLIASNIKGITSRTSVVPITDIALPDVTEQCGFFNISAVPMSVFAAVPTTTLSWDAPNGCAVGITAWRPNTTGVPTPMVIPNGTETVFPNDGRLEYTPPKPTSFLFISQTPSVSAARTLDIEKH